MKKFLFALIIFSLVNYSEAQNHWVQLNFPDSLHIQCITTNDYGDIFVGVGYNNEQGGVYRSLDEGMTWELVYDDGTHGILSLDIDDNGHIFAGSNNGFISLVMSENNGDSWEIIETPEGYVGNVTLVEHYNDALYINMWGSISTLFRTHDLGNTWDTLYRGNGPSENVTSLKFDQQDNIIISTMGFQQNTGGVYKSNANGNIWTILGLFNHQISGMDINADSEVFTCDWSLISGDNCGINAMYSNSNEFELIQSGSGFADLQINSEGNIYACGTFGMIYSEDNGYSFQYYDTTNHSYIDVMHISSDDYIYIGHNSYLAKSALSTSSSHVSSREEYVSLYPNPASSYITLSNPNATLQLYSLEGQLIITSSSDEQYISLEGVASGVYVATVKHLDKVIGREKLIVR